MHEKKSSPNSEFTIATRQHMWHTTIEQSIFCLHKDERYPKMYRLFQIKNTTEKTRRKNFQWLPLNDTDNLPFFSPDKDSWLSFGIYHKRFNKRGFISAINCNFVFLEPPLPSALHNKEDTCLKQKINIIKNKIIEKCKKSKLPEPQIIYSIDGLHLIWYWKDYMVKHDYFNDLYGYHFNHDWEAMQKKLCAIFNDLWANPRKLAATSMFRIPGSINSSRRLKKLDNVVCIIHQGKVLNSYEDMQYALGIITSKPETQQIDEWEHFKSQSYDNALLADEWEKDVLRLHPGSNNLVCIFRKTGPRLKNDWVRARNLKQQLMSLAYSPNFYNENIYISQLEFSKPKRTIENVCSIGANFLDLDYKELRKFHPEFTENPSPEEWRELIFNHLDAIQGTYPDSIIFSGGGAHIKWIYKSQIKADAPNLKKWQSLQKLLAVLFRTIGADYAALDASRVLRLPGSYNQKNEEHIFDHGVRSIYCSRELRFSFDALVERWLEATTYFVDEESLPIVEKFRHELTLEQKDINIKTHKLKEHIFSHMNNSHPEISVIDKNILWHSTLRLHPHADTWIHLSFPDGCSGFIQTYELKQYLEEVLYPYSEVRISASEYSTQKFELDSLLCNYVVINNCPGENLQEQINNILNHCKGYRDVGIPLPNQIILEKNPYMKKNTFFVIWRYSLPLPSRAISRWQVTQEFLCRHFEDWGAMSDPDFLTPDSHFPVPSFIYDDEYARLVFEDWEASYTFNMLAIKVLHFSQEEVRIYKAKKHDEKVARAAYFQNFNAALNADDNRKLRKKRNSFSYTAEKRFNDIMRLLEMRKNYQGEVPEGHRELCVFYAAISAIQANIVPQTKEGIETLLQKLIDSCGTEFNLDCSTKTFGTLIKKFLSGDNITYRLTNATIIKVLGITKEEQERLVTLRVKPKGDDKQREPRDLWLAEHSTEREKPWLVLRISRATWFRMKQREKIDLDIQRKISD